MLIMYRRRRACEIIDLIDLYIVRESDVVANQFKLFVLEETLDVPPSSGKEVIEAEDLTSVG
jgi:hypothetical protein